MQKIIEGAYWTKLYSEFPSGKHLTNPLIAEYQISLTSDKTPFIKYFESDWGDEFHPREHRLETYFKLEARYGRSAKLANPNFYIIANDEIHLFSICYSGNYQVQITNHQSIVELKFYLEEGFETIVSSNFHGYDVIYVKGPNVSEAGNKMTRYVREVLLKNNDFKPPVTFNPWWVYEDSDIDEVVYKQNVDAVKELGFDVCILDASWFGDRGNTFWEKTRGDWDVTNETRFPSGIQSLSDYVHAAGMKFGIWIEIEAIGEDAKLHSQKPELVAKRDGERFGMICLGSEQNVNWAIERMSMLIDKFNADYILLDFNIDPMQGCNCLEHDHGLHDGLYYHYQGLYKVLRTIKQKYPQLIIENCSSGGLRIDLGLMENLDYCYMSDPDFSELTHQCYQGFRLFLPPERINHFTWSYALDRGIDYEPIGASMGRRAIAHFDFDNPNNTDQIKKYGIRSASHHAFGMAQPFKDMKQRDRDLVTAEIKLHKHFMPFIKKSKLICPKYQSKKMFEGNRNPYYLFLNGNELLIYAFGLEMAEPESVIELPNVLEIEELEAYDQNYQFTGNELIFKIVPQSSQVIKLKCTTIDDQDIDLSTNLI